MGVLKNINRYHRSDESMLILILPYHLMIRAKFLLSAITKPQYLMHARQNCDDSTINTIIV